MDRSNNKFDKLRQFLNNFQSINIYHILVIITIPIEIIRGFFGEAIMPEV